LACSAISGSSVRATLGELLARMPKATGTRGQVQSGMRGSTGSSASKPPVTSASTLADLGLDRKTAMVAQPLAAWPKTPLSGRQTHRGDVVTLA
jgi:hypothetical protein